MSGNTFGRLFRLTTYGESHGPGIGGVIDGCPPGVEISEADIQEELDRRKPGSGIAATARRESDTVRILSGVFEGRTTGTPVGFHIANEDQRSRDYGRIAEVWRPGHADYAYDAKYGFRDYRGGGRSSGRETACRVVGGALARRLLHPLGVSVRAYPVNIGGLAFPPPDATDETSFRSRPFFAPSDEAADAWDSLVRDVRAQGDTVGGVVRIEAFGVPAGLGEPVFDKLDARIGSAMLSVGAVKGVSIGAGFEAASLRGSDNNDSLRPGPDGPCFLTNNAGGTLGGISSGQPLIVDAAVKPIPSVAVEQETVACDNTPETIRIGGRHDICAIPRIVPVLESMMLLLLADFVLLQKRNI